jgi:amino acid transporter
MSMEDLQGSLGKWELVFFAVITMVPIAPMGIFGIIAELANGHVPLIYLLGAIGMVFTAWGYGQFAKRYPNAGSVYAYVGETFGSHIGFMSGWAILLDYLLLPALVILVSAEWLRQATGVSVLVWGAIFIIVATYLNIKGIDMTIRATKVLFVFEVFVFAVFSIVALFEIVTNPSISFTLKPFYNPETFNVSLILTGASIAVLSFLGFDVMTTLAEETEEARENISQAALLAIPIMAFFFVTQTYLAAVIHPGYQFQNEGVAFYFVAQAVGGNWLQFLCLAGTVIAWGIGDTLAVQAGMSRILMAMGREGHLPDIFSHIHPEYKTPYVSSRLGNSSLRSLTGQRAAGAGIE